MKASNQLQSSAATLDVLKEKDHVPIKKRRIRSFVRRGGRLSASQWEALQYQAQFEIPFDEKPMDFSLIFGNDNPVTLEIGFGRGEMLVTKACEFKDHHFIGVEVYRQGIASVVKKCLDYSLDNVRIIHHDAVAVLTHQISPNSLHTLRVFFPDPWPKSRHKKRRLIQSSFLQLALSGLQTGGYFHVATDWSDYAKEIKKLCDSNSNFVARSLKGWERPKTKFEKRGEALGHEIWEGLYQKV